MKKALEKPSIYFTIFSKKQEKKVRQITRFFAPKKHLPTAPHTTFQLEIFFERKALFSLQGWESVFEEKFFRFFIIAIDFRFYT